MVPPLRIPKSKILPTQSFLSCCYPKELLAFLRGYAYPRLRIAGLKYSVCFSPNRYRATLTSASPPAWRAPSRPPSKPSGIAAQWRRRSGTSPCPTWLGDVESRKSKTIRILPQSNSTRCMLSMLFTAGLTPLIPVLTKYFQVTHLV